MEIHLLYAANVMTTPLTPEQTFQRDIVVAAGQGMLKGLTHRRQELAEAEASVAQTLEARLLVAKQMVGMDLAEHPEEGREQRMKNLAQLVEAVVYGTIVKGQSITDALNLANRQRDRLFINARSTRGEMDAQIIELAVGLKAGVLQGRLMVGSDFESANSESRQVEEVCLTIARRLHEINQADYPADQGDARLRGVGQLFAAGVIGSIQRGDGRPTQTLLRTMYDKHTSLFASVQRVIDTQLERTLASPVTKVLSQGNLGQALNKNLAPSDRLPINSTLTNSRRGP